MEERQLQQRDWQRERPFLLTLAIRACPSVTDIPLKSSVSPHLSSSHLGAEPELQKPPCARAAAPARSVQGPSTDPVGTTRFWLGWTLLCCCLLHLKGTGVGKAGGAARKAEGSAGKQVTKGALGGGGSSSLQCGGCQQCWGGGVPPQQNQVLQLGKQREQICLAALESPRNKTVFRAGCFPQESSTGHCGGGLLGRGEEEGWGLPVPPPSSPAGSGAQPPADKCVESEVIYVRRRQEGQTVGGQEMLGGRGEHREFS